MQKASSLASQPILVVLDLKDTNVYSRYVTEILRAEGIFSFESIDLASTDLDSQTLQGHSLVITCTRDMILRTHQKLIEQYVRLGGSLLSVDPPPEFDSLLGVRSLGRTMNDGYIQFDLTHPITQGVTHAPLQFFGQANLYAVTSSTVVAKLSADNREPPTFPAFGVATVGKGMSAFIAFDLGRSIVFTRQGKPLKRNRGEGVDNDGDGVFKCSDLFYGTFDYSNRSIPQADEQQKVFAHIVMFLLQSRTIVPRVWYFPFLFPSVALLTGDHHGQNWHNEIQRVSEYLDRRGGHYTFFVYSDMIDTHLTHDLVRRGHTVAPHLYYPRRSNVVMRARQYLASWFSRTYFFRPRFADLRDEVEFGCEAFSRLRVGAGAVTRLHYLIWPGWTETPQLLAQYGFQMDFSISGANPQRQDRAMKGDEEWNSPSGFGYINGSGHPMRFLTTDGKFIDLFGQSTVFEDDVAAREVMPSVPNDSLTTQRLIEASRTLIDESIEKYHSTLVWNLHPEHVSMRWPTEVPTTWPLITSIVDYLGEQNIPMLGANEWLQFVRARSDLQIEQVEYDSALKSGGFSVVGPLDIDGLTLLVPLPIGVCSPRSFTVTLSRGESSREKLVASIAIFNGIGYLAIQTRLRANRPIGVSYSLQ